MTRLYAEARKSSERPVERLLEREPDADPARPLFSTASAEPQAISQDATAPWVLLEDPDSELE